MSRQNLCNWTLSHTGEAGFRPAMRTQWDGIPTDEVVDQFGEKALPRIRAAIGDDDVIGFEVHYPFEINNETASSITEALTRQGMYYGMITPGLHKLKECGAYGGPASLDKDEREAARRVANETIDLAYSDAVKKRWDPNETPTIVLWNGGWGYDIPHPLIPEMRENLDESMVLVVRYEKKKGGKLYIDVEPKGNEGHPNMLVPTVASAIALWERVGKKGVDVSRCGVNMEFGHTQMLGLDTMNDISEQLGKGKITHVHANDQGYDGIRGGGPGKFDIDHGVALVGPNIGIVRALQDSGYQRWIGHDMQARPHDSEEQAYNRVIQSMINWKALERTAREFPMDELRGYLEKRDTLAAELLIGDMICWQMPE
jgi:xylose isomerase